MTIDVSQFRTLYLEESKEGLEVVEAGLLRLAGGARCADTVNEVFRAIHSIKGGSGTFGLAGIGALAHVMETLLDDLRGGRRAPTADVVQPLLEGTDRLRTLVDSAIAGGLEEAAGPIVARLQAMLGAPAAAAPLVPSAAERGWRLRFVPKPHLFATGNDPQLIFRELEGLGPLAVAADLGNLPPLADLDPEMCHLGWTLELDGPVPRPRIEEAFAWVDGDCLLEIAPLVAAPPAGTAAGEPTASAAPSPPAAEGDVASIRVATDKIDTLINMAGELVITQSMLGQLVKDADPITQQRLRRGLDQLERNTRELQESVMRIRMLPVRFTFNRFHRTVHDLSRKLGKKVELRLTGEDTELDKTVLEKIADPLMHLVRNCIDHGIEAPEARRAAGKPESGVVHLTAAHRSGSVILLVEDDGAGLNRAKIESKARRLGLVDAERSLAPDEVDALIFLPGLSTAEAVSEVSGRGVGMDVVAQNIKLLGGDVQVRSVPGAGTTFSIKLPLTLAILDGQMVNVAGDTYICPLTSIVESVQMRARDVLQVAGRLDLYRVRDQQIPILWLAEVLRTNGISPGGHVVDGRLLVIVEADGRRVGLVVDELLGQQQVVIKSLESNFRRVPGVSSATILGDGTVALILDVNGLVRNTEAPRLAQRRAALA